jgi:hypothetical protein
MLFTIQAISYIIDQRDFQSNNLRSGYSRVVPMYRGLMPAYYNITFVLCILSSLLAGWICLLLLYTRAAGAISSVTHCKEDIIYICWIYHM